MRKTVSQVEVHFQLSVRSLLASRFRVTALPSSDDRPLGRLSGGRTTIPDVESSEPFSTHFGASLGVGASKVASRATRSLKSVTFPSYPIVTYHTG